MQRYVISGIEHLEQGVLGVSVENAGLAFLLHCKHKGFCNDHVQRLTRGSIIHVDMKQSVVYPVHDFEQSEATLSIRRVYVEGSHAGELNLVYDSQER